MGTKLTEELESDLDLPFEKLNVSYRTSSDESRKTKHHLKKREDNKPHFCQNKPISNKPNGTFERKKLNNLDTWDLDEVEYGRIYCTNKKRRHKSKSVIREAKLILPVQTKNCKRKKKQSKQTNDNTFVDNLCACINESEINHNHDTRETFSLQQPSTCGSQYMNYSNETSVTTNIDDETTFNTNELASYFEQMLYIPKPMSLMAEMMYA